MVAAEVYKDRNGTINEGKPKDEWNHQKQKSVEL